MTDIVSLNLLYAIIVIVLFTIVLVSYGFEAFLVAFFSFLVFVLTIYVISVNLQFTVKQKFKNAAIRLENEFKSFLNKVEDKVKDVINKVEDGLGDKVKESLKKIETKAEVSVKNSLAKAKRGVSDLFE